MKKSILHGKVIILLIVCFLLSSGIQAKQQFPYNLPATLPVPEWVRLTDWNNPNIFKIDSLITLYGKKDKKSLQSDNNKMQEEPYLVAYLRWKNFITPFIKPKGDIEYDSTYYTKRLRQAISNQNNSNKNKLLNQDIAGNWTALGPIESYVDNDRGKSCEQTNVYHIAIAPSNPNILYSVSETGIIFKSYDKGLHWRSVSDALPALNANSLAVDPKHDYIIYCNAYGYSLLKSVDGGQTWSLLDSYTGGGGEKIIINPVNGRILIIGSTSVFFSDDEGSTWNPSNGSNISGYFYDIIQNPVNNDIVYAAGNSSDNQLIILKSIDGGENFNLITDGIAGIENAGALLGMSASDSNVVYCLSLGNTVPPKLLKSIDGGSSWNVIATSSNTSLTGGPNTTGLDMSNGQGFYDAGMVVDPYNADNLIMGTTTTYKSTDGGINFAPLGGYIGNFGIHCDLQGTCNLGHDTYLVTDGGINLSTDFFTDLSNWSVRNNGLTGSDYWGFGQGWDEDIVVGGRYHNGDAAVFENYGKGNSLNLGGGEDATGHVFHGYERTVGFEDIGTYQLPETLAAPTKNADINNTMWPQNDYYGYFSSKLVIDPRYSNVYYLGRDSMLWKSSNNGSSYNALYNFGYGNKVWRFDISRSNSNVIYVCASQAMFKTTDAGITWTQLTLPVTNSFYNSDVAINPLDENEVCVCMANNPDAEKVYKSIDGGSSWINITGESLKGTYVSYLQFQGGTNGGIYAITSINSATKVFYRDNTMAEWIDFSNGLKPNYFARCGGQIFYRDNKLRLVGSRGVWESPLYTTGTPVAQPMADKRYIACSKDTVRFFDYSILNYAGASRHWSFPGASWVSDSTSIHPKVLYSSIGNYSVTLTVKDSLGQSHTKTIPDMITFIEENCSLDTLVGKCLSMNGTSQTINLGKVNINSNTFSMSCWVKPNGNQVSFSQILAHYGCPGSPGFGLGLGFTFSGYTPNLTLCYTDDLVNYYNNSGLTCDSTQWNFVVLTYSPSEVDIYLNGISAKYFSDNMPALDLSQSSFFVNADILGQGGKLNAYVDEIKFYDYTLSQDEVREKMHLIQNNPDSEPGLLKYYQFNKYNQLAESVYDVIGGYKTDVPESNIMTSTAPVSTGTVNRILDVNSGGRYIFKDAGVELFLPDNGTYPDGDVVAFHLNGNPDQNPDNQSIVPGYFIINSYGNDTFTRPDSIKFGNLQISIPNYKPGNFVLFNRPSGAYGNTWNNKLDSATIFNYNHNNSELAWASCENLTSFGQFAIVNKDEVQSGVSKEQPYQTDNNVISDVFPNPSQEWCSVNIKSKIAQTVAISISDLDGRNVYKALEEIHEGSNDILLKLPELSEGLYLIHFKFKDSKSVVRKLMVE